MSYASDIEVAARVAHIAPLKGVAEKTASPHTELLVTDMQNDFCTSGGLVSKDGRDISAAQRVGERLPAFIDPARETSVCAAYVPEDHVQAMRNIDRFFGEDSDIATLSKLWVAAPAAKRETR